MLKLNATKKLRTQLLFPNSHPIVQDDLERLKKMGPRNAVEYDLDWSSEPEETCPKWLKQHWAMMQELEASVAKKKIFNTLPRFNPSTLKVSPKDLQPLNESRGVVHSQRVQHALDIFNTAGTFGQNFINTSQSIHRMISGSSDLVPCITPSGTLWSMRHKRYLTGRDVQTKMVSHVLNIGSTAFQKMHANMFWP